MTEDYDARFERWLERQTYRNDIVGWFATQWLLDNRKPLCPDWHNTLGGQYAYTDEALTIACRQFSAVEPFDTQRTMLSARVPRHVPESRKISAGMRAYVLERDCFRCRRCGNGSKDGVRLVVDHIVAVAKGGSKDHDNLQTLCFDCNAGKSDRDPHPHDLRR
jgi:5-methylcytosine-specific restriction endonuclease McrA